MIEININRAMAEAQHRAHVERSEAFHEMLRAVPRLIKSIRTRS